MNKNLKIPTMATAAAALPHPRLTINLSVLVNDWNPQLPLNQDEWNAFIASEPIKARIKAFEIDVWETEWTSEETVFDGQLINLKIVNDFL